MIDIPKPARRGSKPPKRIKRSSPPRVRMPARYGDYRARYNYGLKLWSRVIKARRISPWCPSCAKRAWHDGAHCFIKGKYRALALDPDNGAPLCRACHRWLDSDHSAKERFFDST